MKKHMLHERYTMEELVELDRRICADPANYQSGQNLFRFTERSQQRLTDIRWAIHHHLKRG